MRRATANLRTNIMYSRGFDSSIILIQRGGIIISTGDFPESLSQAILVRIMLLGRSCVDVTRLKMAARVHEAREEARGLRLEIAMTYNSSQ